MYCCKGYYASHHIPFLGYHSVLQLILASFCSCWYLTYLRATSTMFSLFKHDKSSVYLSCDMWCHIPQYFNNLCAVIWGHRRLNWLLFTLCLPFGLAANPNKPWNTCLLATFLPTSIMGQMLTPCNVLYYFRVKVQHCKPVTQNQSFLTHRWLKHSHKGVISLVTHSRYYYDSF